MPSFTAAVFASSLAASAYAAGHNQHANLHMKRGASGAWSEPSESATPSEQCGCTTYTTTWYGEPTLVDNWDYSKDKTSVAAAAMPTSSDGTDRTTTVLRTVSVAPLQSSSDSMDTTTTVTTTVDMAPSSPSSYAIDTTTVPTTVLTTETLMTTATVQATTYITGSPDDDSKTHMTTTKTIDSTVTVPYTKKVMSTSEAAPAATSSEAWSSSSDASSSSTRVAPSSSSSWEASSSSSWAPLSSSFSWAPESTSSSWMPSNSTWAPESSSTWAPQSSSSEAATSSWAPRTTSTWESPDSYKETSSSSWAPEPSSTSSEWWAQSSASSSWAPASSSSSWSSSWAPEPSSTSSEWWAQSSASSSWAPASSSASSWSSSWTPEPSSTSFEWWAQSSSASSTWATSASSSWAPASSSASSWSSSAPSASASSSSDSGSISTNGDKWAMTYTPYAADGSCKDSSTISADISSIASKGFTTVRLYATDCNGPVNIGNACAENGLKMILGIYVDGSGIGANTDEQVSDLIDWGVGQWEMVEMVVFGNEAVFNGYCSASQLASGLEDARSRFSAAGYTGPVTTTEPLGTIQENAQTICPAVDVIAANIHPFFNTAIFASKAGEFVSSQLEDLADACNGEKEAYNLETGWPSSGLANGLAIPGFSDQKTAIESIMGAAGSKSVLFSFENDDWKAPGDLDVEQYWGCANLFSG
ncbi:hypothetical protein D0867_11834 [Hortaea werneckii]|uniref:Probable beta-glucosidase btgE n=1 Tax=Hortaea werneckii TaxID=91943 RepID=A0A3M6YAW7_HORWE|nr:hypothetical protein KC334_g4867 [Hortaea werneckii]KAI7009778.1 hypothetical protein KC355_g6427 [Hortaea werneckii]RMY00188.1 hypothetical protein D0867_11834 [Hortaea werneckii]RMY34729.1 hypothetical protein D0866_05073 [Hortaea werneckii]